MNPQFKFFNKRVSVLRGVVILILFSLLAWGGILIYWQMIQKELPLPSVEFFLPVKKEEIEEEKKITEGKLFIIQSNPTSGKDGATDMAIDSEYIYIAGYQSEQIEDFEVSQWRIEKRDKKTGELIKEFGKNGVIVGGIKTMGDEARPYSITIDFNFIYVVGDGG